MNQNTTQSLSVRRTHHNHHWKWNVTSTKILVTCTLSPIEWSVTATITKFLYQKQHHIAKKKNGGTHSENVISMKASRMNILECMCRVSSSMQVLRNVSLVRMMFFFFGLLILFNIFERKHTAMCCDIMCECTHFACCWRKQNWYDGKTSSDATEPFETTFYFHIHVLNSLKFSRCEDNEMTDNRNNQHITSKVFCRKMQTHAMGKNMRNSPKKKPKQQKKQRCIWKRWLNSWTFECLRYDHRCSHELHPKRWQMKLKETDTTKKYQTFWKCRKRYVK